MKEEKLEEAKRLYETANADQKYVLESLFPELAGSEDERIRKELLEHCINRRDGKQVCVDASDYRRWADWLEKQGQVCRSIMWHSISEEPEEMQELLCECESNDKIWHDVAFYHKDTDNFWSLGKQVGGVVKWAYIDNLLEKQGNSPIKWNKNTKDCKPKVSHSVLMQTTHGIAEGEWQGEQWHQYRWAGIVRDTDVLSWIELSDLEKQGEQKSIEWDEYDDDKFFFLKARLKDYEDCIIYDEELSEWQKNNVRETTKEFLEWLDSIKERMGG